MICKKKKVNVFASSTDHSFLLLFGGVFRDYTSLEFCTISQNHIQNLSSMT